MEGAQREQKNTFINHQRSSAYLGEENEAEW